MYTVLLFVIINIGYVLANSSILYKKKKKKYFFIKFSKDGVDHKA